MKLFDQTLTGIGDDEPVFLLKASDAETPSIAHKAAFIYRARHGESDLADALDAFGDQAFEWQHTEGNAAPPPVPKPAAPAKKASKKKAPVRRARR